MGSLDRMMAKLIGDATGLPVGGLVRKVGARNLLLLGGAAIAGGMIADSVAKRRSAAPPGAAPPPPPPPPAPVLPPLPPLPAPGPAPDRLDLALLRTMAAGALADGRLDERERRAIRERLDAAGLDEDQAATIRRDLVVPPGPEELAGMVDGEDARRALYRAGWLVTRADGALADSEAAWLDRLAAALGLDAVRRRELEGDLLKALSPEPGGAPPTPPA